ncbi:MAG: polysaccharide pyruvyl transferase family protein [Halodesulfovibrio sp.]|uniref:polysaccharide pyruvyl transferase family protein n=1 Tax=Halodesulfovibrio sp. TaxID=1912772 RepID=UPI00359CC37E
MKILLTHCYTDKNKGDAAIIIATTQLIRSVCENANIHMMSTFSSNDPQFDTEHELISKFCNKLHPALFGQPTKFLGFQHDSLRIISFIVSLVKCALMLTSKRFVSNFFFSKEEVAAFDTFLTSDVIISKGGSYITTQNKSLRQFFSMMTMLFPFILAARYKKKIVIFSQSLGPVTGFLQKYLFKVTLSYCTHIFLRERYCLEKYEEVAQLCASTPYDVIPDSAFAFDISNYSFDKIKLNEGGEFKLGLTVVDHAFKYIENSEEREFKRKKYFESIIELVKFVNDRNGYVHVFPQVTVPNSHKGLTDTDFAKNIVAELKDTKYSQSVFFYDKELTPFELKDAYSNMDVFIGTRLHSVIFALSSFVPAINISYHGTKSRGIFKQFLGSDEFVLDIDTIDGGQLIAKVGSLIDSKSEIRQRLVGCSEVAQLNLIAAMRKALSLCS